MSIVKPSTGAKPVSVGFISLGCPKNLVDSQIMAQALVDGGLRLAPSPETADVIVVNTCAFIEAAREESIEAILSACRLKGVTSCRAVLVAGCLPQRYRQDLRTSLPEVDAFIGLDELDRVAGIVRRLGAGGRGVYAVSGTARRLFEPRGAGLVLTGAPYAYLKVAEGCNHRCAFCAIPGMRGAHRSRPLRSLVREAEHLLELGFRELDIISQDVMSYGCDLGHGTDLAGLLRALGRIGGDFWIRLLYGYPTRLTDPLLHTMGEVTQVCRYLDIPIQHSHPDILRAMRRASTVNAVAGMAERARRILPDVTLRTTCLVGFPGETAGHFRHLREFVRRMEFDHVGLFAFSPEEGTAAWSLPNSPSPRTARTRCRELAAVQRAIVDNKAAARIGGETEVLLEKPAADQDTVWLGRARRQAPDIDGDTRVRGVPPGRRGGDRVRVRYTAQLDYDMEAVFVTPA